jgi:nucleoside-diphosphate-sugar epimerase
MKRHGPLDVRPDDFEWAGFGRLAEGRPWQGRKVAITGGTGFIGARLAHKLALYGASVTIPTRDKRRVGTRIDPNIALVAWNTSDAASVSSILAGCDTLYNLAYDFRRSGEANISLYRAIADAAVKAGVERFVHASSIAVYDGWPIEDINENSPCDGPGHEYKMAKRAMEHDLTTRVSRGDFDATIIQPVNVYGPFSAMWTDAIVERICEGGIVLPRGFDGLNNAVHVDDLVDAFIAAGDLARGAARRFIVAGPTPIPWADMFGAYAEACGKAVVFEEWQPVPQISTRESWLNILAKRASSLLAGWIGTARVSALRTRLSALRGRGGPYRPVPEDPRFFLSRAVVHGDRAASELRPPIVDAAEGLARTKRYIGWRFGTPKRTG